MSLAEFVLLLEGLEKVVMILAIIIGGLWAYYHYFRGRVYQPRLEADVSGDIKADDHHHHLNIKMSVKNVGLSKLDINRDASGLRVFAYTPPGDIKDLESANWERLGSFAVFKNHQWVESGETIEDHILLSVQKGDYRAFRFMLRLVGRNISWKTEEIAHV